MPGSPEQDFRRFCTAGDTAALGRVFERLAPELLLVAAHLAGGNVAEDLVQATFLDAIDQRARWDQHRPLAPWLVGILSNHVLRARRENRRAPDPHRLQQRDVEGPLAAAEAREFAETVHAAVEGLPVPYRQVLSLRLVHGFELQQISSVLGMPIGTVKTRLHRGMVLLRRALPAGLASSLAMALLPGRGLAAMRVMVLSHAAAAVPATAAVGVVLGTLTMKKAVVFIGVVALTLGAWIAVSAWPPQADARPQPAAPAELHARAEAPNPAVLPPAPDPAKAPDTAAPVQREPVATTGSLEVEAVWSDGSPASGVGVYGRPRNKESTERLQPMVTDAQGQVTFAELAPGEYGVVISRRMSGKETRIQVEAGTTAHCRLAILDELLLEVQVVDSAERPQAGAEVWGIVPDDQIEPLHVLGRTDGNGLLVHRCLSLSRIWARKAGSQSSLPTLTSLLQDERGQTRSGRVQVRLVLGAPGCELTGQVVDPQGGPAARAVVVIAQDESLPKQPYTQDQRAAGVRMTTAADGRFRCDEVGPGDHAIQAVAPGFAPAAARVLLQSAEPTSVTLHLAVGATLRGRVVHRDGTPIAGAEIDAVPYRTAFGFETYYTTLCRRHEITDVDGRYRLAALRPGEFMLSASAEGSDSRRTMAVPEGPPVEWNVTLPEGADLTGTVVDAEGKGLQGWTVMATGGGQPNGSTQRRAITGPDGRFVLQGLPDANWRLLAFDPRAKGAASQIASAAVENVRPPATDLVLRVVTTTGGFLAGRISWPDGAMHLKTELSLYPKERSRNGRFVAQERLTAGIDTFRIGPLPPGDYDLFCDAEGRARFALHDLRIVAGQTVTADFHLELQHSVRLRLRDGDGKPVSGAEVRLFSDSAILPCKAVAAGEYQSPPTSPGSYTAKVRGGDFAPFTTIVELTTDDGVVERTVTAATAVVFRFRPAGAPAERWVGALGVTVKDAQGAELVKDTLQIDGTDHFDWRLGLAAGSYTLQAAEFMRDARCLTTVQVAAAAEKPQLVEVQLEKK